MTIFAKKPIVIVQLSSEYASVIINLISTSATQLYSKATKINEVFIGTPHFFLKLVHKEKLMSNELHTQAFWLVPNVTIAQKIVPKYRHPCSRDSEIISSYML